jgi:hypothetical protein
MSKKEIIEEIEYNIKQLRIKAIDKNFLKFYTVIPADVMSIEENIIKLELAKKFIETNYDWKEI